jgi:hypothetical protein
MKISRLNISLEGYDIGLSGAVPEPSAWSEPAMDRAILEFVALFSGTVFKYGGRIVHGSHPTFTPVILRQARLHASDRLRKPVTLVMSELWSENLNDESRAWLTDVAELVSTKRIGDGGPEVVETRNRSLSAMRKVLVNSQNVMVAVGGKMHDADGIVPGIREEMDLAETKQIPRFLIAGMGGYSAEYARNLVPESLMNGLSSSDNAQLLSTTDVSACVSVILGQLATSEEVVRSAIQPVRWNPGLQAIIDHRDGTIDVATTQFVLSYA